MICTLEGRAQPGRQKIAASLDPVTEPAYTNPRNISCSGMVSHAIGDYKYETLRVPLSDINDCKMICLQFPASDGLGRD